MKRQALEKDTGPANIVLELVENGFTKLFYVTQRQWDTIRDRGNHWHLKERKV